MPSFYEKELESYLDAGFDRVEIMTRGDDEVCPACRSIDQVVYEIEHALKEEPLPHDECQRDRCRCRYVPIIGGGASAGRRETGPCAFSIDADTETIYLRFTGFTGVDTFVEAAEAVISDSRWKSHYDCLCDLRPAKEVSVSPRGLKQLARYMIDRRETLHLQGKIAVLIHRWTLKIVCHLLEFRIKSEQADFRVFNDEEKALDWLGLSRSIDVQEKAVSTGE